MIHQLNPRKDQYPMEQRVPKVSATVWVLEENIALEFFLEKKFYSVQEIVFLDRGPTVC